MPGHDRRYAMDASKLKSRLGCMPEYSFEDDPRETVKWYLDNRNWSDISPKQVYERLA